MESNSPDNQLNKKFKHDIVNWTDDIFSNHLIAEKIWKHFTKSDLLKISSVSKLWQENSRELLQRNYNCSIYLGKNPCVDLKIVNDLLQTSSKVFFNGLHHDHKRVNSSPFYGMQQEDHVYLNEPCKNNCLSKTNNMATHHLYTNLLEKITFNYIRVEEGESQACPFSDLIRLIIRERSEEIKDLRIHDNNWTGLNLKREMRIFEADEDGWFPNLETVQLPDRYWSTGRENLYWSAPKLKKILGCFGVTSFATRNERWGPTWAPPKNKHFALTSVTTCPSSIFYLATVAKPKLEYLRVYHPRHEHGEQQVMNFTTELRLLATNICDTLTEISCQFSVLMLIATAPDIPPFQVLKNAVLSIDFHSSRYHQSGNEPNDYDLLKLVNFDYVFPNLVRVENTFWDGPSFQFNYEGLVNNNYRSSFVTSLTTCHDIKCICRAAEVFPNIKFLDLTNMPTALSILEGALWHQLEELSFSYDSINPLLFDPLVGLDQDELLDISENLSLEECKNLCIVHKQQSILNRAGLKKLCIKCISSYWSDVEGLNLPKGSLVSAGVAKLIAAKFPGFTIKLTLTGQRSFLPQNVFEGINTEHLESYADISSGVNMTTSYNHGGHGTQLLNSTMIVKFRN